MKDLTKTISQILFILISFVFIVLITSGFSFNAEHLASGEFWGEVVVKEAVLLVMFNIIYDIDRRNRMQNPHSNFYIQLATRQMRVARIYSEKLFEELKAAIKLENEERLQDEITRLLHKVSVRVSAEDLPLNVKDFDIDKWAEEMKQKYALNDEILPRLKKVAEKILNGKIKVNFASEDGILLEYDQEYSRRRNPLVLDLRRVRIIQSAQKAGTFLVSTAIMTSITFAPINLSSFWQAMFVNIMLMLSAFVSGIGASILSIKLQAEALGRQNLFLCEKMGLTEKFVPKRESEV